MSRKTCRDELSRRKGPPVFLVEWKQESLPRPPVNLPSLRRDGVLKLRSSFVRLKTEWITMESHNMKFYNAKTMKACCAYHFGPQQK